MSRPHHVPVMVDRVVALLSPGLAGPSSVLVDATLGLGGHTKAVLAACPTATVVGLDRDAQALELARGQLEEFGERSIVVQAVYDEIASVLARLGLRRVQGVLFDLGVSSMQLDEAARGFSYAHDAPLDMRMNQDAGPTAADLLNTASTRELSRILSRYGEERFSRRIAEAVVRERAREPFANSGRLVELVRNAIPAPARRTGGNPAKRTFQALRIAVNDELSALQRALPAAIDLLCVGGRIVVMSYHSLEDRLAKQTLVARATSTAPLDLPVVPPGHDPQLRLLTRGAEVATHDEIEHNPRAASVKMRAAERVREVA